MVRIGLVSDSSVHAGAGPVLAMLLELAPGLLTRAQHHGVLQVGAAAARPLGSRSLVATICMIGVNMCM